MVSISAPATTSVLSMQLEQEEASLPQSPRSPLDADDVQHSGVDSIPTLKGVSSDPPVSLKQDSVLGFSRILMVSESQHPVSLKRRETPSFSLYDGSSTSSSPTTAAPLTACSYQTMQQEYDKDTWRMYERIQSARTSREEEKRQLQQESILYSCVCDAVQETDYEDFESADNVVAAANINTAATTPKYPPTNYGYYEHGLQQHHPLYVSEEDSDDTRAVVTGGACDTEGIFELDF